MGPPLVGDAADDALGSGDGVVEPGAMAVGDGVGSAAVTGGLVGGALVAGAVLATDWLVGAAVGVVVPEQAFRTITARMVAAATPRVRTVQPPLKM
jgi:hypothetical protein